MSLCSAEEDGASLGMEDHDDLHSPTDVSEDSVEVRVTPITAKRKLPQQQQQQQTLGDLSTSTLTLAAKRTALAPSPKRRRPSSPLSPFRPWSVPTPSPAATRSPTPAPLPPTLAHPAPAAISVLARTATPPGPQEEPLALVKTRVSTATTTVPVIPRSPRSLRGGRQPSVSRAKPLVPKPATRFSVESIIGDVVPSAVGPTAAGLASTTARALARIAASSASVLSAAKDDGAVEGVDHGEGSSTSSARAGGPGPVLGAGLGGQQRNYKNMTRERRIEANARERTRVHTISAAFETLRKSVPAYSNSQKLSKLSVLRIACSYILTLSRVAGMDYSADQSQPAVQECVDLVTRTIQTEGKLRRKRDE